MCALATTESSQDAPSPSPTSTNTTATMQSNRPNKYRNNKRRGNPPRYHRQGNDLRSMFRAAKQFEKYGEWQKACHLYNKILQNHPTDSHSHLALARLEAKRERKRRIVHVASPSSQLAIAKTIPISNRRRGSAKKFFERGTTLCPDSIHLWQAWAVYEESCSHVNRARQLYEKALQIDPFNPYVCHAYGLMEKKMGFNDRSKNLWETALNGDDGNEHNTAQDDDNHNNTAAKNNIHKNNNGTSTAALVCSLGELLIARKEFIAAREMYQIHLRRLKTEKDLTEVYLAAAWLEERFFRKYDKANELIQLALQKSPTSSLAQVAMARLEGRRIHRQNGGGYGNGKDDAAVRQHLAKACTTIENNNGEVAAPTDGRVFNAWAKLEVRSRNFSAARNILRRGMIRYPMDYSLLQAAGKVEEHFRNYTGSRNLYSASLSIQPSAPTLVAYAMLESQHPQINPANYTVVKQLFEEALLVDPRHGPAYNAYGNAEVAQGHLEEARRIFQRGVNANCSDAASIHHGYGKLELSLGNIDVARAILMKGWKDAQQRGVGTDSPHNQRAQFLVHTLGMLELNSNRPSEGLQIFQDGINTYGNSSQLLLGSALCETMLGRGDSARILFELSVQYDNKHAQAWQTWGVMEMRAGNFSTAKILFECGIKSAPRHGALFHAYATMESKLGNIKKARAIFAAGIKKSPGHVSLYQGWATLELREDNVGAAKKLITEALTRNKKNALGWIIAAEIEQRLGNEGLVGLILKRGIECAPSSAELYRVLGEHLVKRGKIDDARQIFEKGIEVNPLYPTLYHSLAELEARVCNLEGLVELNKKAARLFNTNELVQPPPPSFQSWGKNIKSGRHPEIPKGIAALAEKIVKDDGSFSSSFNDIDLNTALESLNTIEDELVLKGIKKRN